LFWDVFCPMSYFVCLSHSILVWKNRSVSYFWTGLGKMWLVLTSVSSPSISALGHFLMRRRRPPFQYFFSCPFQLVSDAGCPHRVFVLTRASRSSYSTHLRSWWWRMTSTTTRKTQNFSFLRPSIHPEGNISRCTFSRQMRFFYFLGSCERFTSFFSSFSWKMDDPEHFPFLLLQPYGTLEAGR
jgi:hypothetical protein